jgi:hypothetical protein
MSKSPTIIAYYLRGNLHETYDSAVSMLSSPYVTRGPGNVTIIGNTTDNICRDGCYIDFYSSKSDCCDRNLVDVRITALVVVVMAAIAAPWKAYFVYKRTTSPIKNKGTHRNQLVFGYASLIYDICFFIHGLMKLFAPTEFVLGNPQANIAADFVFFFSSSCYVIMLHCMALNSSQFLAGTLKIIPPEVRERVSHVVYKVENIAIYAPAAGILLSMLPFFGYASPSNSDVINSSFLFGYWCVFMYQTMIAYLLGSLVLREMRRAVNKDTADAAVSTVDTNEKIEKAIKDMVMARRINGVKQLIVSAVWLASVMISLVRYGFTYFYMMFYMITYGTIIHSLRGFWHFGPKKLNTVVPVAPAPPRNSLDPGTSKDVVNLYTTVPVNDTNNNNVMGAEQLSSSAAISSGVVEMVDSSNHSKPVEYQVPETDLHVDDVPC